MSALIYLPALFVRDSICFNSHTQSKGQLVNVISVADLVSGYSITAGASWYWFRCFKLNSIYTTSCLDWKRHFSVDAVFNASPKWTASESEWVDEFISPALGQRRFSCLSAAHSLSSSAASGIDPRLFSLSLALCAPDAVIYISKPAACSRSVFAALKRACNFKYQHQLPESVMPADELSQNKNPVSFDRSENWNQSVEALTPDKKERCARWEKKSALYTIKAQRD